MRYARFRREACGDHCFSAEILTINSEIMKLRLPGMLMAALAAVTVTGALHAAPITPTQDNIVTTKDEFVSTEAAIIVKDGDEVIQTTDSLSKGYLYAREGAIEFTSGENADMQTVSLSGFSVSGQGSIVTFDKVKYTDADASESKGEHVGGIDGKGVLNIRNNSVYDGSNSDLFTIGVNGNTLRETYGSEGTYNSDGTDYKGVYTDKKFGSGAVNVEGGSRAQLTSRQFQMGEGTLNVDNSTVIIGNEEMNVSAAKKGFRATLGVGTNTTSTINVTNGGSLEVYTADYNGNNGGFSTNYSQGTTTNILVDNASFTSGSPIKSRNGEQVYRMDGDAYIGCCYRLDDSVSFRNTVTNIDIKNGGVMNLNHYTVNLGYARMVNENTKVNITVHDKTSELSIDCVQIKAYGGVTIDNSGTISIDTTHVQESNNIVQTSSANFYGGNITNRQGATISAVNGFSFGNGGELKMTNAGTVTTNNRIEVYSGASIENSGRLESLSKEDYMVFNMQGGYIKNTADGQIICANQMYVEQATIDNYGTIALDDTKLLRIYNAGTVTNYGNIDGGIRIYGDGAQLTAADGSSMKDVTLRQGTMLVEGCVSMEGNLTKYDSSLGSDSELIFTMDGSLDMNGYSVELGDIDIVLLLDTEITAGDMVTDFSYLNRDDLFVNYTSSTFSGDTQILLRDAYGHETYREFRAIYSVPEPAAAALSLLAVAGLAARRRRR